MRQILTLAIAVYWLAHFANGAVDAGQSLDLGAVASVLLACGHAVVATGFLWLATECALDGEAVEEVAALAVAAATLLLAVISVMPMLGLPYIGSTGGVVVVAALAATFAAIRLECAMPDKRNVEDDFSPLVARRMAAGAAHGSMLSRIARRPSETVET